jgi:hypothetical protein
MYVFRFLHTKTLSYGYSVVSLLLKGKHLALPHLFPSLCHYLLQRTAYITLWFRTFRVAAINTACKEGAVTSLTGTRFIYFAEILAQVSSSFTAISVKTQLYCYGIFNARILSVIRYYLRMFTLHTQDNNHICATNNCEYSSPLILKD